MLSEEDQYDMIDEGHQTSYSEDEYDSDGDDDDRGEDSVGSGSEIKQHLLATLFAIIAAVVTHAQYSHGGSFSSWKVELTKDWMAVKSSFTGRSSVSSSPYTNDNNNVGVAPYAAPSMDAIPTSDRLKVLERQGYAKEGKSDAKKLKAELGGHEKARNFRRTRGLSFCPNNGSTDAPSSGSKVKKNNLVEMEFILSLGPTPVLHSYYLADALGLDSSMVYDDEEANAKHKKELFQGDIGTYTSDTILNEIDTLMRVNDGEGLMLDQIQSILESHLPPTLVDRQHACLLHQYTLNKSSGRSIRGTTMVYDRPHVSTFYRSKFPSSNNALAAISGQIEPNYKVPPASLTFTGYAAKFINLSLNNLNLYWDGGRIESGPRAGEIHTVFVGTVPSMESIGTSSFPGHSFFLTTTYDKDHVLKRWAITEDEPILYYDTMEDLSIEKQHEEMDKLTRQGKWTDKQRFKREAWMLDRNFGIDYLVKTQRVWLANFPSPYFTSNELDDKAIAPLNGEAEQDGHMMHMWQADFIGQTHKLDTPNLYYTTLPATLNRLTTNDYLPDAVMQRHLKMRQFQSTSLREKNAITNTASTMQLNLKVLSCAPRVLEVKKFLSPVEVQHLIDLASGAKGDVVIERSTVSASNFDGNRKIKKVRGSKADARSSTGGWIHREQDVIVDTIFRRIADLLNIDEDLMRDKPRDYSSVEENEDMEPLPTHDRIVEAMQLLRYEPGQEYSAHHDFTYPSIKTRYQPKRYATILLYLTGEGDIVEDGIRRSTKSSDNVLQGGATTFPRAITTDFHDGVTVEPFSGKAVVFYNVLPDGNMDDLSQHSGGKVEKGVKYIANVWVWDPIVN